MSIRDGLAGKGMAYEMLQPCCCCPAVMPGSSADDTSLLSSYLVFIWTFLNITPESNVLGTVLCLSKQAILLTLCHAVSSGACKHTCTAFHISFVQILVFSLQISTIQTCPKIVP